MMVLNGARVLPRCLLPLKGIIGELVVIDTGSTDNTKQVLEDVAFQLGLERFYYERLHPLGSSFFTDEAASWKKEMPGPFTGARIPSDWAAVRNLALDNTTADYVLKLDADDEPICPPENWLRTLDYLDTHTNIKLVSVPYEIYDGKGEMEWLSMYDRLWRRSVLTDTDDGAKMSDPEGLRWVVPFHEYLDGKSWRNTLYTTQGLRVRDWRDSPGVGVRVAHRNLKVLLWNWENGRRRTLSTPNELRRDLIERFTLAHEAAEVFPLFARELLDAVMGRLEPEDRGLMSDCYYHQARISEALGDSMNDDRAIDEYEKADEIQAHTQALLKLFFLHDRLGDFTRCRTLREKILARTGQITDPPSFNCDLQLAAKVREWGKESVVLYDVSSGPGGFPVSMTAGKGEENDGT